MNPNTGKGWTDTEEATFADIMRVGRLTRIKAIHLWARCRRDPAKAVRSARENYGLSEVQEASYEQTKAARLAGLVRARLRRAQNRAIQQTGARLQAAGTAYAVR